MGFRGGNVGVGKEKSCRGLAWGGLLEMCQQCFMNPNLGSLSTVCKDARIGRAIVGPASGATVTEFVF